MARIYYDQCEVKINDTGVLATSINLNTDITLGPVYTLGKRKPFKKQITTGPRSSNFQISYLINPTGDPSFDAIKTIKNLLTSPENYPGVTIALAGITGYNCYLNNYSLKIEPNNVVVAQANYITYHRISGDLSIKDNPNPASADSIAHSSRSNVISGRNFGQSDIYNLNYTFALNLNPIYTIGQEEPIEVKPIRGQETVNMTENLFQKLVYTGENLPLKIEVSGLLDSNKFDITMPDAYINNSTIESNLDDIVRTTKTIVQYY